MSNHDKIDELIEAGSKPWAEMRESIYYGIAQMFAELLMGDISKPIETPEWYKKEHENDRTDEANRREG